MPSNSRAYQKKNYKRFRGQPDQIKNRSKRNAARRLSGLAVGDSREIDHIKGIDGGNGKANLRAISREANRKEGVKKAIRKRKSRKARGGKY